MAPRRIRKGKKPERTATPQGGRPTVALALGALMIVSVFAGVVLFLIPEDAPTITYGVEAEFLQETIVTGQGGQSDFVLVVHNTGSHGDSFDVAVESNDGGFDIAVEAGFESVDVASGKQLPLLVKL